MSSNTTAADARRITQALRPAPSREDLYSLGSDLMRGDGLRVVSAWKHMASVRPSLMAHEKLYALVRADVGDERAGGTHDGGAAWICKPYVRLFRSFGEQWPQEALRMYLQFMGVQESVAGEVWERTVARYEAIARRTH